jgi:hypothetical protein
VIFISLRNNRTENIIYERKKLSTKSKEEIGINLTDYILKEKVIKAKR